MRHLDQKTLRTVLEAMYMPKRKSTTKAITKFLTRRKEADK